MKIVTPNAKLVRATQDGDRLVYLAAHRCYSDSTFGDLLEMSEDVDCDELNRLISHCIKSGHTSVLEHAGFTFHITCSRSASHQLVRHRIASYSQQSQRYVRMDNAEFIIPDAIDSETTREHLESVELFYSGLTRWAGAKPEDARAILPNCTATHIVMTTNARELLHFFRHRCCNRAQAEIRGLAWQMLEICQEHMPVTFAHAGPACMTGKCTEAKPCGHPYGEKE